MILFLAAIAVLAPPAVQVRHYRVTGDLTTNGKETITRRYDAENKALTFELVTDWEDKTRLKEIMAFDEKGQPLEIFYEVTGGSNDHFYSLKAEKETFRTSGGALSSASTPKKLSDLADISQFWFVNSVPAEGATQTYVNLRPPFFLEQARVSLLGPLKEPRSGKTVPVVERSVGNGSPRIRDFLDEQGMPLRREWWSGTSETPYRVDQVVKED